MLLVGCAQNRPPLPIAPQLMSEIAAAPKRPIELSDSQKRDVLEALKGNGGGGAKGFFDPAMGAPMWASFWRSPLTREVDRNRLIVVRYSDEGSYVFVGFERDGKFFTDGFGQFISDPPWSQ
jgi:hypothetical protein